MVIKGYDTFNHYTHNGNFAVRAYDRHGNGSFVCYVDTLSEAEKIRTRHGLSIGLEPEPTYKDFAYYPTIWKWEKDHYTRLSGY